MPKLVVLDADKTIWSHGDISSCKPPFRRASETKIIDSRGEVIELYPGVRRLLRELKSMRATLALVTWNMPDPVIEALEKLGIRGCFDFIRAEPHPEKHKMIASLLEELSKMGVEVKPRDIIYVDDRDLHLPAIVREIGQVRFIHMWVDVKSHDELLKQIKRELSS